MPASLRTATDAFVSEAVGVRWTITAFALAAGASSLAYIALTRSTIERLREREAAGPDPALARPDWQG